MTKKKSNKKMNKWLKFVLWVLGVIAIILFTAFICFKIWVSTWQEYKSDDFGFSFRYPRNWYIGGTDISKKQFDEKGVVFFWVDSQTEDIVRGVTETKRSLGNVQVAIEGHHSTMDVHERLGLFSNASQIKYGKYTGFTYEDVGGLCDTSYRSYGNLYKNKCPLMTLVLSKSFDLKAGDHYFYVNSLSSIGNMNVFSQMKARFYHWIGSTIVDSFIFN